jgi:hypothetical protein
MVLQKLLNVGYLVIKFTAYPAKGNSTIRPERLQGALTDVEHLHYILIVNPRIF